MNRTSVPTHLPRLQQTTTANAVTETLRSAILDGKLVPGEQLREQYLSVDLGVSRAPVRDAINELIDEGLVFKIPYKGATVAHISKTDIGDIAEVRKLVEARVIEAAITSIKVDVRPMLEDELRAMERAAKVGAMSSSVIAHMKFHRVFYAHCGNAVLVNVWKSWEAKLQLFFSKDHTVFDNLHAVAKEHEHLLNMAYSGDSVGLCEEVARHVHGSVDANHWTENPPKDGYLIA